MPEIPLDDTSREQRLERVLADYLRAEEQGQPLDQTKLLAEHPDLADDLASFFRNRSAMRQMAEQVQPPEVGAVGPRLLHPDDTVQHAGIVVGVGGIAEHLHGRNLPQCVCETVQSFAQLLFV